MSSSTAAVPPVAVDLSIMADKVKKYWEDKISSVARLVPNDHVHRYRTMVGDTPAKTLAELKARDGKGEGESDNENDDLEVKVDHLAPRDGDNAETKIAKFFLQVSQEYITHWRMTHAVMQGEPSLTLEDPSAAPPGALAREAYSLDTDNYAYINGNMPRDEYDRVSFCADLQSCEWITAATSPVECYTAPVSITPPPSGNDEATPTTTTTASPPPSTILDTDKDVYLRAVEGLFLPSHYYEKMRVNSLYTSTIPPLFRSLCGVPVDTGDTRYFSCQADVVVASLLLRHAAAPTVYLLAVVHDQQHLFESNRRHLHKGVMEDDLRALSTCGPVAYTPDASDPERTSNQAALKASLRDIYQPYRYLSLRSIPFKYLNTAVDLHSSSEDKKNRKQRSEGGELDVNAIDREYFEAFYQEAIAPLGSTYIIDFITSTDGMSIMCDWLSWRHQESLKQAIVDCHPDLARNAADIGSFDKLLLCSNVLDQAYDRVDKYLMQRALQSAAPTPLPFAQTSRVSSFFEAKQLLMQPPWYQGSGGLSEAAIAALSIPSLAADSDESLASLPTSCFPIVAKPANGAGSEFVSLCRSWKDLRNAFIIGLGAETVLKKDATVMCLQEYLGGGRKVNTPLSPAATNIERYEASSKELVVDTVTYDGVHFVTDVWYSRKLPLKVKSNRLRSYAVKDVVKKHTSRTDKQRRKEGAPKRDGDGADGAAEDDNDGERLANDEVTPPVAFEDDVAYDSQGNRRELITTTFVYDYQNLVLPIGEGDEGDQDVTDAEIRAAVEYVLGAVEALGMRNGIAHTEIMLTYPHVKNGLPTASAPCVPKLIELNPRVQGDIPRATHVLGIDQFLSAQHLFSFRHGLWRARLNSDDDSSDYPIGDTSLIWPPVGALPTYGVSRSFSSNTPPLHPIANYFRNHVDGSRCHKPHVVPFHHPNPIYSPTINWSRDLGMAARHLPQYLEKLALTPQGSPSMRAMNPVFSSQASTDALHASGVFDWNAHAPRASQPYDPSRLTLHVGASPEAIATSRRMHATPSYLFQRPLARPRAREIPNLKHPMTAYPIQQVPVSMNKYRLKVVFMSSSDAGVMNEHGRIWLRDYLPGFVRFTRAADLVKGPNVRKGFLLSIHKTIDIFSCPAAIILFGPKDVVETSASILRFMESTSPASRPLKSAIKAAARSALSGVKSNDGGVSIKDAMITVQRAIAVHDESLYLSDCFPMLGTCPTLFSFLFQVGKQLRTNANSIPPHHPASMTMLDLPLTLLAHLLPTLECLIDTVHPDEADDEEYDGMALFDNESEVNMRSALPRLQDIFKGLLEGGPRAAEITTKREQRIQASVAMGKEEYQTLYNSDDEGDNNVEADILELLGVTEGDGGDDDTRLPTNMDPSLTIGQLLGLDGDSGDASVLPNAIQGILRSSHSSIVAGFSMDDAAAAPPSTTHPFMPAPPAVSVSAPLQLSPSELSAVLISVTHSLLGVNGGRRACEDVFKAHGEQPEEVDIVFNFTPITTGQRLSHLRSTLHDLATKEPVSVVITDKFVTDDDDEDDIGIKFDDDTASSSSPGSDDASFDMDAEPSQQWSKKLHKPPGACNSIITTLSNLGVAATPFCALVQRAQRSMNSTDDAAVFTIRTSVAGGEDSELSSSPFEELRASLEKSCDALTESFQTTKAQFSAPLVSLREATSSTSSSIKLIREIMCLVQLGSLLSTDAKLATTHSEDDHSRGADEWKYVPEVNNNDNRNLIAVLTKYTSTPSHYPAGMVQVMELCDSTHTLSEASLDLFGENRTQLSSEELAPITNFKAACLLLLDAIEQREADAGAVDRGASTVYSGDKMQVEDLLAKVIIAAVIYGKAISQAVAQWCAVLKPVFDLTRAVYSVGFPLYEQLKGEVNSQWRRPHYPPPLYLRTDLFGLFREVSLLKDLVIPSFAR